jgi:hypothetical protein
VNTSKKSEAELTAYRNAKLDEALAMLRLADKEIVYRSFVSLSGFYGLILGGLKNKVAHDELFKLATSSYAEVMSSLPPEVFELILSAITGGEVSVYEDS